MRPEDRNPAYLWDMLQAAREVEAMLADHDLAAFLDNLVLLRAIERGVEIIGEAARRVSVDYMTAHRRPARGAAAAGDRAMVCAGTAGAKGTAPGAGRQCAG